MRPEILFHATRGQYKVELIRQYGLLANTPTLAPGLNQVYYFQPGDIVTCWRPEKGDVRKRPPYSEATPTTPIPEGTRKMVIDGIQACGIPEEDRVELIDMVNNAKTILPSSRLVAIFTQPPMNNSLHSIVSPLNSNFYADYTDHREQLVKNTEQALRDTDINLSSTACSIRELAEHIIHAELEHRLLVFGIYLATSKDRVLKDQAWKEVEKAEQEGRLQQLERINFSEPYYERYRRMLVSSIKKFLNE